MQTSFSISLFVYCLIRYCNSLDQADWEVHRNRLNDYYLDCLKDTADGFEFEVEFFQYLP